MKKSRYKESQIVNILKEAANGTKIPEICRRYGISDATFYNWRSKYGGMDIPMVKRLRELEQENFRLKRMYANAQMDNEVL